MFWPRSCQKNLTDSSDLANSPEIYISWTASIFGFYIHTFYIFYVKLTLQINSEVKKIMYLLTILHFLGFFGLCIVLAQILFMDMKLNYECDVLDTYIYLSGPGLQNIASMISIISCYIAWNRKQSRQTCLGVTYSILIVGVLGSISIGYAYIKNYFEEHTTQVGIFFYVLAIDSAYQNIFVIC